MLDLNEISRNGDRPLIMGIVNVSGDSFSEGAQSAPESGVKRAVEQLEAGANLLDIGGESTRPGSLEICVEEELSRVIPVIRELKRRYPAIPLSVDTRKAEVAKASVEAGAEIINDVSMLRYSPEMAKTVAQTGASLILCHSRGTPQTMRSAELCQYADDVVAEVVEELRGAKHFAMRSGIPENKIWLDPGPGFAKTSDQDWELIRRIDELHELGPIVAGFSRKSFLGNFLNQPEPMLRLGGGIAVALYLAEKKVEMLRVHDVRQICDALSVWNKLR